MHYSQRLTSVEQLLPGMTILLISTLYGADRYVITCKPYTRDSGTHWFVRLRFEYAETEHEYSLEELGITVHNPDRWVTTMFGS